MVHVRDDATTHYGVCNDSQCRYAYLPDTLESENRRALLAEVRRVKAQKKKRTAEFRCMECSQKFYSVRSAELASYNGCPKCGGCDIDLNV